MTTCPNIRFAYMYRDAGNYKLHGEVIFSNEKQIAVDEIRKQIHSFLSDGLFFIARQVHVEERFFDVVSHDDHPWHEVVTVEATSDPTFDPVPEPKRDIAEFLADLEKAHHTGWDEMNVREDITQQIGKERNDLKDWLASRRGSRNPVFLRIIRNIDMLKARQEYP